MKAARTQSQIRAVATSQYSLVTVSATRRVLLNVRSISLLAAACLVITALCIGIGISSNSFTTDVALLTAAGISLLLPILVRIAQRRFDVLEPLTLFGIAWLVMFFARPIAMLVTGRFEVSGYPIRDGFDPMLLLALVGGVGFLLGYALPIGRDLGLTLPGLPAAWRPNVAVTYSVAITLLGISLFGVFIASSGGLNALRSLLTGRQETLVFFLENRTTAYIYAATALTLPAALFLIATAIQKKSIVLRAMGFFVLSIGAAIVVPSGIRSWLLPFLGAPFVLGYLSRRRRPGAGMLFIVAFLAFTVNGFLAEFRQSDVRQSVGTAQLLTQNVTRVANGWDRFILGGDTEMPDLLSLVVLQVPAVIPFQHGAATAQVFVQAVPRQFWPSKPRPGDEMFTQRLFIDPGLNPTSRQYTPLANFYIDFGYIGALIGMLLIGLAARTHYEYLRANEDNPGVQLFYASTVFFWIVLFRGSIGDVSGRLFWVVPPLLLGMLLAKSGIGRGQRRPQVTGP